MGRFGNRNPLLSRAMASASFALVGQRPGGHDAALHHQLARRGRGRGARPRALDLAVLAATPAGSPPAPGAARCCPRSADTKASSWVAASLHRPSRYSVSPSSSRPSGRSGTSSTIGARILRASLKRSAANAVGGVGEATLQAGGTLGTHQAPPAAVRARVIRSGGLPGAGIAGGSAPRAAQSPRRSTPPAPAGCWGPSRALGLGALWAPGRHRTPVGRGPAGRRSAVPDCRPSDGPPDGGRRLPPARDGHRRDGRPERDPPGLALPRRGPAGPEDRRAGATIGRPGRNDLGTGIMAAADGTEGPGRCTVQSGPRHAADHDGPKMPMQGSRRFPPPPARNPAASYSPRDTRPKYHRRWRA